MDLNGKMNQANVFELVAQAIDDCTLALLDKGLL
jgi:hypothetical protein